MQFEGCFLHSAIRLRALAKKTNRPPEVGNLTVNGYQVKDLTCGYRD